MSWKFKPSDFGSNEFVRTEWCALVANEKLQQWLSEAPIAYGQKHDGEWTFDQEQWECDTHTARLIDIREIKPESAIDLLREMVEWWEDMDADDDPRNVLKRAKKLIEREGE